MKRFLILLFIPLLLCSCIKNERDFNDTTIIFTDATGYPVKLPDSPKKVAVLFSSLADIWVSAGGEIAVTVFESVERGFARKDTLLVDGGAGKSIDNEALIASSPDLVICSADIAAQLDTASICRDIGIPVLSLRIESFEDYLNILKLFTTITENKAKFTENGVAVKKEIEKIQKDTYDTSYLFIRAASSAKSTKAKNAANHFVCAMLDELGAHNIAEKASILLDGISFEEVLLQDPEYIFISTMGDESAAKEYMSSLLESDEWSALTAVKRGNVHYLPKDMFQYKPNSRWDEAYHYLANILKGSADK